MPDRARRSLLVAAYALGFCVLLPWLLWRAARALDAARGWPLAPHPAGWAVAAAGLALMLWAMADLWRTGRGLPVSALPPPALVRGGAYRVVRHPIYLGFNLALLGAGLGAGSRGLALAVAPLFLPAWIGYALLEERGLRRRFPSAYRRYAGRVGLLPRLSLYPVARFLQFCRVTSVRVVAGREHVPRRGAAVLVFNHACYLDAAFVGAATRRTVRFLTTAEVYRGGPLAWAMRRFPNIPVRRYRPDVAACRELVRGLADGDLVAIAPEGERSVLGAWQGAAPGVASIVARLGVPVIPLGISGNYDGGPRWAEVLRRRPVRVRVGAPVRFAPGASPARAIDEAITALLEADPQPLDWAGLPRARAARVLWRCPACGAEPAWDAARLACAACGERFAPEGGQLRSRDGRRRTLAALGAAIRAMPEPEELRAAARGSVERDPYAPIGPLEPLGEGTLVVGTRGLRWNGVDIPLDAVRSASTERADTLQVATREAMWQFRLSEGSAFRMQAALERRRRA